MISLMVRRVSNDLIKAGLVSARDIWEPLKYFADMGLTEFTDVRITPCTAYERDGVVRLTTKGGFGSLRMAAMLKRGLICNG